jgi:branched-chain amino acid transport system substrate-binding protein
MHRGWYWILAALLFTLPLRWAMAAESLVVAGTLSLTGKYAELGKMKERGFRLWEKDVNRRGGILGRPVKVILVDDESNPALAKRLYTEFATTRKVDFVLGPYSSEITHAVADVTEQYGYPLLASGASASSMWERNRKYLFGVYVTTDRYTVGFIELLVRNGLSKLAIVSGDEPFSKGILAGTTNWAGRFGLDIVHSSLFPSGSVDIEAGIRAAQASGAEALLVAGHFKDSVNASHVLKEIGWQPKAFFATVGPALDEFGEVLGADSNYAFSSSQWEPNLAYPRSREFTKTFIEHYKIDPSYHAATAFAAGEILEAAISKAKSLDRRKVREQLLSLDVITVIGRYGVDKDGRQVRHFTTTVQWQNGKKEIVAPRELKTADPLWR